LLADYLEAQHDLYEAMIRQAINDPAVNQTVNQFVNARRAVGNEPPVTLTDTALFHELRVQRSRDFYQGGLRLGDLRRWKRDGVGVAGPNGAIPDGIVALVACGGERVASALTGPEGAYRLAAPAAGCFLVEARRIGYQTWVDGPVELQSGDDWETEFHLRPV